mmetsp:Transcript_26344/g.60697  ORF Transcript_26344/g.60697 Transcript_26344/m.60697 type:complete len:281 (+) Transcript_26344:859-1701(+)
MPRLPQPLSHTLLATRMPTRKDDVHGMVHTNLTFFVILSVLFPLPPLSPPERRGDVILPILRVEGAGGRGDRHDGPRRYVVHGTRSHQEHFAQGAEEAVYRGKLREGEDVVPIGRVPGDLVVRRPRAPFFPGQDADLFLRPHAPGDGKIHAIHPRHPHEARGGRSATQAASSRRDAPEQRVPAHDRDEVVVMAAALPCHGDVVVVAILLFRRRGRRVVVRGRGRGQGFGNGGVSPVVPEQRGGVRGGVTSGVEVGPGAGERVDDRDATTTFVERRCFFLF